MNIIFSDEQDGSKARSGTCTFTYTHEKTPNSQPGVTRG